MKRFVSSTAMVAWVLAAMSALVAVPALAQQAATSSAPGENTPPPPPFVFNGDGLVVIDGDVPTSCFDFAQLLEDGALRPSGDQEQLAQSVLGQCEQAGFLSPNNQYVAHPPAQGQQPPATQAELPTTGGPGPSIPRVPLAGGVLLVVVSVLGLLARRRAS